MLSPPDGDGLGFQETELSRLAVGYPLDELFVLFIGIGEQSIEELPQLHTSFSCREVGKVVKCNTLEDRTAYKIAQCMYYFHKTNHALFLASSPGYFFWRVGGEAGDEVTAFALIDPSGQGCVVSGTYSVAF